MSARAEKNWCFRESTWGRWGRDLARSPGIPDTLAGLVRHILVRTGLPRLRLSSIEPMDWDAELIGLMREFGGTRLARHAHLPLQSGSDRVLRRMHRRYRPWHYAEKVAALMEACGPELTLGADVMAGEVESLDPNNTVVGLFETWPCAVSSAQLDCGDVLALCTDGVTESTNDRDEEFGQERLVASLRRHASLPAQEVVSAVIRDVLDFSGGRQFDDLTLIVARRTSITES